MKNCVRMFVRKFAGRMKTLMEMFVGTFVKPMAKPVMVVFGIIVVGMVAMLRANFSYMDDLGRTVDGYKGWGNFSRYLSNFLAMGLHGHSTLTDISPWGQIVAAFLMAVAGVMTLYIVYGRKKFRWWELGVAAMLALNPYFLVCLSYKFDAPFMATAVLGMIMPLAVWRGMMAETQELAKKERRRRTIIYIAVVAAGTLATGTTYQAALGILPMMTVLIAARMICSRRYRLVFELVGKTALGYVIGLLVFRVFLMKMVDDYVVTAMPAAGEILPTVARNLGEYYRLVGADMAKNWVILIGAMGAWFVGAMMMDAGRRKWLAGLTAIVTLGLLGTMCFGIYILMEKPLFEVRAMLGVGVMICLVAVVVAEERKAEGWRKIAARGGAVVAGMLAYVFFTFGFTYGNALALQREYTDFRIENVLNELAGTVREGEIVEVAGTIGHAPAIKQAVATYPILGRLVPVQFREGYWGQYKMMRYYGMRELSRDMFEIPKVEEFLMVKEGWYYNLRKKDNVFVVELK